MKSMTGYGLGKVQTASSHIEVSLRTVNGRFLETRFHLPREFYSEEATLKKILEQHFSRGTVDIFISRKAKAGTSSGQIVVNKALAKKYFEAYNQIAKDLKIKTPFHVESIARLPDVIKVEDSSDLGPAEKKALAQAFQKACEACAQERSREGKSIRKDLEKTLDLLENQIKEISMVREEANQQLLDRFEQKIKARLGGAEVDPARISQEVVMQVEKADINEELMRLKEHIKNYRNVFGQNHASGKKLDFYTQELLREVNTIGSKSSVSKLTAIVVESKTLIERLREQVQNLE
jgi:uncharacterized protein (TIGR00255 family)